MNRDLLISALALGDVPAVGAPDREAWVSALLEGAVLFARAGGRVDLATWATLTAESRACLAVAGDRLATPGDAPSDEADPESAALANFLDGLQ